MSQAQQIKKLANFDLVAEARLKRISVHDFMFHLQTMHDENSED